MSEPKIHRFVVKIGSSVLSGADGRLIPERLSHLVEQVTICAEGNRQLLIVTSGAIACGMSALGLRRRPKALSQLQACAAIGQSELMHLYAENFHSRRRLTGQVLLTQEDLADKTRFRNAKQTILALLRRHAIPIINENDTVSVDEITFGDNDRLGALVASAVDAQLLIILSDVDGLLQDGKPVERVDSLNEFRKLCHKRAQRQTTRGGMNSKFEAARIVGHSGIPMVIANGTRASVLTDLLDGKSLGTLFVPPASRLTPKQWWIAFSLRDATGEIQVDAGAAAALVERGKSLLASGIVNVKGSFEAGAFVAVLNPDMAEVARGVVNFSSKELSQVRGMRSSDIEKLLGKARVREVIHRDHMVLARNVMG